MNSGIFFQKAHVHFESDLLFRTFTSMIERRGRNVTLGVVEAIASVLGVDVPTLLTEHPDELEVQNGEQ